MCSIINKRNYVLKINCLFIFFVFLISALHAQEKSFLQFADDSIQKDGIIYRNPRLYNLNYTFELHPDFDSINPETDLKVWIPIPKEWDAQKAVKIISVKPKPHGDYTEPEYENKMLFWDFNKLGIQDSYTVNIQYRLEAFEVHSRIDPKQVKKKYDQNDENYILNTSSTHTLHITPQVRKMVDQIIGSETNPYLKTQKIFEFVRDKMNYNIVRHIRGSGIHSILNFPVVDSITGEVSYQGQCDHFSVLFVTLCRAAGIPTRGVTGMAGWAPWIKENELQMRSERHTLLSPEGYAAARLYGPFGGHVWAEFFYPGFGWIPVDPTWSRFGNRINRKIIFTKGHDLIIGPNAPETNENGYGDQWIPLVKGRANLFGWGVWNIGNIRVAKAKISHTSDPYPADAYAEYAEQLFPAQKSEKQLYNWRKDKMMEFKLAKANFESENIFKNDARLNAKREAYSCNVLRQITGKEKFSAIFKEYLNSRLEKRASVSTEKFEEIAENVHGKTLGYFFDEWVENHSLPQLKLEKVSMKKVAGKWRISGRIIQEEKLFHLPLELLVQSESDTLKHEIWLDSMSYNFDFSTQGKPEKIIIDPDYHIPTDRWMPPQLEMLWYSYPDFTVVYGTLKESQANKAAAERFVAEFAGLDDDIVIADTVINEEVLNSKCLILFGRPETNQVSQHFKDFFPVKFSGDQFSLNGVNYDQPSQGVAQIIENPLNSGSMIILFAGLSDEATGNVCDKKEWREEMDGNFVIDYDASYVIFDDHKKLESGDWKDTKSNMVWVF